MIFKLVFASLLIQIPFLSTHAATTEHDMSQHHSFAEAFKYMNSNFPEGTKFKYNNKLFVNKRADGRSIYREDNLANNLFTNNDRFRPITNDFIPCQAQQANPMRQDYHKIPSPKVPRSKLARSDFGTAPLYYRQQYDHEPNVRPTSKLGVAGAVGIGAISFVADQTTYYMDNKLYFENLAFDMDQMDTARLVKQFDLENPNNKVPKFWGFDGDGRQRPNRNAQRAFMRDHSFFPKFKFPGH